MKDYNLGFISNEDIYKHVKATVKKYASTIDLKQFNKNIIDPIKLTFDAKVYNRSIEEVIMQECMRQIDKKNNNQVGYFHQNLFKYVGEGWVVPKKGFDVVNANRHIFAEIKNKHNTMNSSSSQKTYIRMQSQILDDDEAVCYLVEVISKHSQNTPWQVSLDGESKKHKNIRRISIDKFYELVFSQSDAFFKLCQALPDIIEDVLTDVDKEPLTNTVFEELKALSPDISKSLYKLAFKTYDGFENL